MHDKLNIVTNYHWRDKVYWHDLTDEERADFNYVKTDDERDGWEGFRYRGSVYDLNDGFEPAPDAIRRHGFDGWEPQSYFDGIAVRYFDTDGNYVDDAVVVAHFHW